MFLTWVWTGSTEEAWFDSTTRFDSDGEEDFQSVQDGMFSLFVVNLMKNCNSVHNCLTGK